MGNLVRKAVLVTLLLALTGLSACLDAHAPPKDLTLAARIRRVENGLAERMQHYKVPGLSIAVINEGRVEWARGLGIKEAGKSDPITPETLFQAGSISKPVAALAVLRLVQDGRLSPDEDV